MGANLLSAHRNITRQTALPARQAVPLLCQGIDVLGGMPVPRVSRPGYSPEAGSQADPAAELDRSEAGRKGVGSMHTLRTLGALNIL